VDEVLEVSILNPQDQDCPVGILPQWAALERDRGNVPQKKMRKKEEMTMTNPQDTPGHTIIHHLSSISVYMYIV